MELISHRANQCYYPENSLLAFKLIVSKGLCQGVEIDVRRDKEGKFWVSHDSHGIEDSTSSDLSATLDPLVSYLEVPRDIHLYLDLKIGHTTNLKEYAIDLNKLILGKQNVRLQSSCLPLLRCLPPSYTKGLVFSGCPDPKSIDPCVDYLVMDVDAIHCDTLKECKKPVYLFTVNRDDEMRHLDLHYVKGIFTDNVRISAFNTQKGISSIAF